MAAKTFPTWAEAVGYLESRGLKVGARQSGHPSIALAGVDFAPRWLNATREQIAGAAAVLSGDWISDDGETLVIERRTES